MEREIIFFSGLGLITIVSRMFRIGLNVFLARSAAARGRHLFS